MQAYAATDPAVWGVDQRNYCCRGFALGCPPAALPGSKALLARRALDAQAGPVAKCHNGSVSAVYRCTANNFQVLHAVWAQPQCAARRQAKNYTGSSQPG